MDFTLKHYQAVLSEIVSSGYPVLGIKEYLQQSLKEPTGRGALLLRHDVDHYPDRALSMASIEQQVGIKSTYYFRMVRSVYSPRVISKVQELGHEIGYHYETLDECSGDFQAAKTLFHDRLQEFRALADVRTVCSHGNVRVKKVGYEANLDMFRRYPALMAEEGLVGEAFLSIPLDEFSYIADNGRNWTYGLTLADIPRLLGEGRSVYASIHPDWWTGFAFACLYQLKRPLRRGLRVLKGLPRW